ncbi:MAG: hypothetical protein LH650_03715 [Chloroflexi bacterium]|nr:hypothetical protein [Chloroflexota bacterium]
MATNQVTPMLGRCGPGEVVATAGAEAAPGAEAARGAEAAPDAATALIATATPMPTHVALPIRESAAKAAVLTDR